ncbi:MAG: hypothetical protein WBS20_15625 [Lysobacterales bacterium]
MANWIILLVLLSIHAVSARAETLRPGTQSTAGYVVLDTPHNGLLYLSLTPPGNLVASGFGEARYRGNQKPLEARWEPAFQMNFSGSSVAIYRNGLRLNSRSSPWSVDLSYRKLGLKSDFRMNDRIVRPKVLGVEVGISFD